MNVGVIPARLGSSRFPKKILAEINGKPMVIQTAERASKSKNLDRLIIVKFSTASFQSWRKKFYSKNRVNFKL